MEITMSASRWDSLIIFGTDQINREFEDIVWTILPIVWLKKLYQKPSGVPIHT